MNRVVRRLDILVMMLAVVLAVLVLVALQVSCPDWFWVNEGLHAGLGTIGAFIALLMAAILLRRPDLGEWGSVGLGLGFLGLGIGDLIHAVAPPGPAVVFLYSLAVLMGGVGFAFSWVKSPRGSRRTGLRIVFGVLAPIFVLGLVWLLLEDSPLHPVNEGALAGLAGEMIVLGGILLVLAALRFIAIFHETGHRQLMIMAMAASIFGVGGISDGFAEHWGATWWYWHGLRLIGYFVVFWLVVQTYRRAEAEVLEGQTRLRSIVSAMPAGLLVVDAVSHELLEINESAEKIIGTSCTELVGRAFDRFVCPTRKEKCQLADRCDRVTSCHCSLLAANGIQIPVIKSVRETVLKGRPCLIEIFADIRELRDAEEALRASEERMRDIALSTSDWFWEIDQEGRFTYCSEGIQTTLGYLEEEVLGRTLFELMSPDEARKIDGLYRSLAAEKAPIENVEHWYWTKDGREVCLLTNGRPILTEDGQLGGYRGAYKDITEEIRAQLALVDSEQRLRGSNAELARSNADLEQFAYVASHDLRAPLRAINNLAEWIEEDLDGKLEGESQENMQLLRNRVQRMEALLDGLLQYSRAGRTKVESLTLDTKDLLEAIVQMLHVPGDLEVSWAEDLPVLETEHAPLEQILSNLIGNAVKHRDAETRHIRISARDLEDRYEFAVADDGPGIPPAMHERIFEMFQTLRPRDEVEGSGMGLAIVRRLVESKNGTVMVESDGERGTTFRFTWPKQVEGCLV